MSFRRGGAGKKRDAIEPDIIRALRARGVQVWQINGRALPDLLCKRRGVFYALGIKSGSKAPLTVWERAGEALWPLVCSVDEALIAVGEIREVR